MDKSIIPITEKDIINDMNGIENMGIEITNERLKRYVDSQCNLTAFRYNQSGKCTNEEKRKECVEVSKLVLCLEEREDERERNKIKNN